MSKNPGGVGSATKAAKSETISTPVPGLVMTASSPWIKLPIGFSAEGSTIRVTLPKSPGRAPLMLTFGLLSLLLSNPVSAKSWPLINTRVLSGNPLSSTLTGLSGSELLENSKTASLEISNLVPLLPTLVAANNACCVAMRSSDSKTETTLPLFRTARLTSL